MSSPSGRYASGILPSTTCCCFPPLCCASKADDLTVQNSSRYFDHQPLHCLSLPLLKPSAFLLSKSPLSLCPFTPLLVCLSHLHSFCQNHHCHNSHQCLCRNHHIFLVTFSASSLSCFLALVIDKTTLTSSPLLHVCYTRGQRPPPPKIHNVIWVI